MNMKFLRMSIVIVISTILLSNTAMYSQTAGAAVPFLLITPDARASGMGETGVAIADNVNAIYWNTGGLGFQKQRQVALNFSRWLPQFNSDLYYAYGTFGQYVPELDGTVAFNFILMNLGQFNRTTDNGTVLGTFRSNEFTAGLSYGTMIADDLGAGVQLRYIQSNLAPAVAGQSAPGVGVSGGFDFGLLWKPRKLQISEDLDFGERFSLGLNLANVGPKMTYRNESDPLPTMLKLGLAITPLRDEFNELTFAFDFGKLLVRRDSSFSDPVPTSFVTAWQRGGAELAFGAEYWYEKVIALRGGYFTEPTNIGGRNFITFGAGVRYDILTLDFSFINTIESNNPLANTMRFSLLIDWE